MADTEEYFPRGGKKPTTTYFKQNENFLGGNEQGAKKKKKSKKRSEDDDGYLSDELIQEEDLSYKTCGIWLNYKVMKEGQLFLGRVSTVSDTCVYVSLPCRSSGTVMACHISEAYNKQLEAYVNDQIEQVCELPQMFRPGQYVAVKVLEVQTESSKLMLTMMPQHINSARTLKDLHKGALVQAAVSSVEDHGYVMDIGIANTRAFLPKKSANSDIVHDMGMLVWTVVKSVSADSGVVTLSGELAALQKALQRKPAALLPGTALEFTVDKPLDNGIEGHILDKTTAYIQRYQVDHVKNKKPSLGHKIRARLLYMVPPNNIPFLTMRNIFESTYPDLTQEQKFSSGDIIEEAQVLKIIARSVYMKLGEGSFGLLSLYRIAVHEDLTDEQVLLSSYPIGSTHRVRVTDYNMSDYIYSVSDDAALLAEKYFKLSQLRVGDIVDATITQVHEKYIKTTVGRVTGGVSQKHMYESGIFVDPKKATKSKSSNKKYKEGQVVKARVLLVDNMKNRVTLTLKPSLLDPRIEVLQSYEQAVVGKDYTGVVVDIKTSYLIVSFFNDVTALIPKRLVSAEPLEDITQAFHIGQIVKCTITEVEGKKLIGSLTEVSAEGQEVKGRVLTMDTVRNRATLTLKPSLLDPDLEVLQSYEQAVVGKDYTGVVVDIKDYLLLAFFNNVTVLIPEHLISDEPLDDINKSFHLGQIVKCTITSVNLERKKLSGSLIGLPAVKPNESTKPTMEESAQVKAKKKKIDSKELNTEESQGSGKKAKRKNKEEIDENREHSEFGTEAMDYVRDVGDIVKATIIKVTDNYALATVGDTRGYIPQLHMQESGIKSESPKDILKEGQEVKARVLILDNERNRVTLTLKPSLLDPDLEVLQSYEQAVVGKDYTGVVVDIKKHLLISFFSNVTAFVSKHSVSREPVDLTQLFHLGQIVKCTITEVDLGRKKLSGSLIEMPAVKQNRPLKRTMEDPAQVKAKKKKTDDSANETNIEESPVKKTKRKNKEQIDENREHSEFGTEAMEYVRHVGDIVKATITKVADNYALASVGDSRGYIPQIHMQESGIFVDPKKPSKSEPPNEILKVGQKVTARVLVIDNQKNSVTLTLKPSLLDPDLEVLQSYEQAVVGKDYTGIVVDIKKHLLLAFFNNVTVFISKHLVSAQPLDNLTKSFHLGQIVKCTITSVNLESKKLCGSLIGMPANKPTKHTMGDSVEVTAKGIKVENEKDKKLIKKEHSEESDAIDTDVYDDSDQVLSPEDIILIDLSDCLTAKQFKKKKDALQKCIQSKTDQIDEIDKKITSMEQKGLNSKNKKKHSAKHAEKLILQQQIEKLSDTLILIENKLKEDIDSNVNKVKLIDNLRPAVEVPSVKDFWSLDTDVLADKVKEEYSSSSEEEEGEKPKKKRKKLTVAEKAAKAREEEEKIREMEKRAIESENAPQSSDQFERALLAQPDCSQLWIAYMAFHLQATEIEKARAVGRKALSTINFREEGEKLNVWLALLNIEHRFGTKESQQKTLEDALQMNDKYEIHSKLLDILVETSKPQELVALVELMTRKYRRKASVYTACGEACFKASLVEKARQVMQKGIAALEKNEHVSLLVKFAQLERAHGDRERSEALFEQVLAVYPQRVDVCSAYLDVLLKARDVAHVRQVMERMTSLQLPARKMKALYKKWIEVEEKIGDAEHVETIRQRAIQFIDKAKF
ncbi:protein RRP5 homolog isoform X2 [Bicyclus anynana]|uniref:Protein RRP5 homolog isoform X2 n=1 Tax=Bicyclus anynana TaxID=110368 RepID=A0ABM3LY52_BICAN|nr:protein RRP5 homolog isoform X2 [Bicyclus anynana]